jgi:DNA polymerase-3 subunit epsilon
MRLWPSPPWDEVVYWALDLETGGLDPHRDPIVAVGMVPVRAGIIRLGESYQTLVAPVPGAPVGTDSIRAHQLLPGELESAPPLAEVLLEVGRRVAEGALLVHNAGLDVRFLKRAHRRLRLPWARPRVVDTVELILRAQKKRRFIDPDAQDDEPTLNLSAARRHRGLPEYGAHDALTDAVAAAELFLVLRQQLGARRLRDL